MRGTGEAGEQSRVAAPYELAVLVLQLTTLGVLVLLLSQFADPFPDCDGKKLLRGYALGSGRELHLPGLLVLFLMSVKLTLLVLVLVLRLLWCASLTVVRHHRKFWSTWSTWERVQKVWVPGVVAVVSLLGLIFSF